MSLFGWVLIGFSLVAAFFVLCWMIGLIAHGLQGLSDCFKDFPDE